MVSPNRLCYTEYASSIEVLSPVAAALREATPTTVKLNSFVQAAIRRTLSFQDIHQEALEEFAQSVIINHKKKEPRPVKPKALKPAEIKAAVFDYFGVGENAPPQFSVRTLVS